MEHFQLQHGRWFPDNISKEFQRCYLIYRACLNELAVLAVQAGRLRYHLRPKCHQLGHLTFHFLPRNPRYFHVYQDEDFIARTKRVAEVSDPVYVSRLALFRYIIHVCMMWDESAGWPSRGLGRGKCASAWGFQLFFWVAVIFLKAPPYVGTPLVQASRVTEVWKGEEPIKTRESYRNSRWPPGWHGRRLHDLCKSCLNSTCPEFPTSLFDDATIDPACFDLICLNLDSPVFPAVAATLRWLIERSESTMPNGLTKLWKRKLSSRRHGFASVQCWHDGFVIVKQCSIWALYT